MTSVRKGSPMSRTMVVRLGAALLWVIGAILLVGAGAAFGFWTSSASTNSASALADTLPQGATPSAATPTPLANSSSVAVTFAQVATAGGTLIVANNYTLTRYPAGGGAGVVASPSCTGTTTVTCTMSSVPDGTWQYTNTPTYGSWIGVESGLSPSVTVSTTPPTATVTYPTAGAVYGANWSGTLSGTAGGSTSGVASVALALKNTSTGLWWNGASFAATVQTFVTATGTTSWTYALAAASLVSGNAYSVVARATDNAGNTSTGSALAFTYNTTAPSATVTYPVYAASYGTNWSGSFTGTAAYTNAAAGVALAIEDVATSLYWNGTTFSSATPVFVAAVGTTSWSYAMAGANFTNGHSLTVTARATDVAGNTGDSALISFDYDATPPAVVVTYPLATNYGANWSGTITGTVTSGNTPGPVTLALKNVTTNLWWNGTAFNSASQIYVTASGTTSWSYSLAASALVSGDSYSVFATSTDNLNNVGVSATTNFAYSTVKPTISVSYPVDGTVYGSNWTGSLTGTATFPNGFSGSPIAVAVENTTTGLWWNGSSFSASSQTFVAAVGSTSWSYALASSALVSVDAYTVVARATDALSNVTLSAPVNFTYNNGAASLDWVTSSAAPTCTAIAATRTCTVSGIGRSGTWTVTSVRLLNAAGVAVTNSTGTAIALTCTAVANKSHPTVSPASPTSLSIAAGASNSSSGFTITGSGTGQWKMTDTCKATIAGTAYSLNIVASK